MPIFFYFPVIMGGAEQQARRLARELASRGHRVTIVTGWWDRSMPQCESEQGVEVFRNSTLWDLFDLVKPLRMLKHYAYELSLAWYLWRRCRDYDVIHVHQALHAAFVACLLGPLLKKPVLVKLGCGGEFGDRQLMQECRVSPLGRQFWQVIRRRCNVAVAISDEIREELAEDGFREGQIVTIPNGIGVDAVAPKLDYRIISSPRITSVGRLHPQKGFEVLLEGLACLEGSPRCSIFGDGPERQALEELVAEKGLTQLVSLPGIVHDLKERLPEYDLFVLPSRAEGMSNALMEAMAAGLPCITTKVGGNADMIAPEGADGGIAVGDFLNCSNGILVNPEDPAALGKAIVYLLNHESERRRMGLSGKEWIEQHATISVVASRYLSLYHRLLRQTRHGTAPC